MRTAHKLALLFAAALAVMAFGAASASAQNVFIEDEATDTACNPCFIHAEGESELHTETGIRILSCQDTLEAEIYSGPTGEVEQHTPHLNHWGHVYSYLNATHPTDGPCSRVNCLPTQGPGEDEWPIANVTETGNETVQMIVRFCLRQQSGGLGVHCNAVFNVAEDHVDHHSILTTNHHCAGVGTRMQANWEMTDTANHDELMFHHVD